MPNRVDANVSGVRPTVAEQRADREAQANQVARVEISAAAQARNQELAAADARGTNQREAALNAPGARPSEQQGGLDVVG